MAECVPPELQPSAAAAAAAEIAEGIPPPSLEPVSPRGRGRPKGTRKQKPSLPSLPEPAEEGGAGEGKRPSRVRKPPRTLDMEMEEHHRAEEGQKRRPGRPRKDAVRDAGLQAGTTSNSMCGGSCGNGTSGRKGGPQQGAGEDGEGEVGTHAGTGLAEGGVWRGAALYYQQLLAKVRREVTRLQQQEHLVMVAAADGWKGARCVRA